jgi:hypothetical protein
MLVLHIGFSMLLLATLVASFTPLLGYVHFAWRYALPVLAGGSGLSGLWLIATSAAPVSVSCYRGVAVLAIILVAGQRQKVLARA